MITATEISRISNIDGPIPVDEPEVLDGRSVVDYLNCLRVFDMGGSRLDILKLEKVDPGVYELTYTIEWSEDTEDNLPAERVTCNVRIVVK